MPALTLAAELLLLTTDDEKGTHISSSKNAVTYGLATALLLELHLRREMRVDEEQYCSIIEASALEHPLLDRIIHMVMENERKRLYSWINDVERAIRHLHREVYNELVDAGILEYREKHVFGLIPLRRYPQRNGSTEQDLRRRLDDAIAQPQAIDERMLALLAVIRGCRIEQYAFEKTRTREAKSLLRQIFKPEPALLSFPSETLRIYVVAQKALHANIVEASAAGT